MKDKIFIGHVLDVLKTLPDRSVHMVCTSPPYLGLRDYGIPPQIWDADPGCEHEFIKTGFCSRCGAWRGSLGLEPNLEFYVKHLVDIFREVKRVLRDDGTLWLNLGDSYASGKGTCYNPGGGDGSLAAYHTKKREGIYPLDRGNISTLRAQGLKPKDLMMMPARVAVALQADGWWIRSDIIWHKRNCMPGSQNDRPTTSHEHIFLLSKSHRYFYDDEAVKEICNGTAHDRGHGVNPKAEKVPSNWDSLPGHHEAFHREGRTRKVGKNSRMHVDRDPAHQTESAIRSKQNRSFSEAVRKVVTTRKMRDVWTMATVAFKDAHFATFPPELPEKCIRAGTSEKGCCPECGAPWKRIVEKKKVPRDEMPKDDPRYSPNRYIENKYADELREGYECGMYSESKTIGWKPTCEHGHEPIPCTVLDIFGGSGTVGEVARNLGRRFILIDLNENYIDMQVRRVGDMFCQPEIVRL
jgi:DNA modification methylase